MKNKMIKNLMVCGLILTTTVVPITTGAVAFADSIEQAETQEITEINVSYGTSLKPEYGESKEFYYNLILDTFIFKDQGGNLINKDLLDIELRFHDKGTHYFEFDEFYKLYAFNPDAIVTSRVGLTATLKENPNVQGIQKVNGATGLGIWVINNAPEISTKIDNPTVFEGANYNEWENITFSDLEDDRDNLILQKSIVYPENFNKNNMQSGEYQIIYRVTDSKGKTSETIERLTVTPTFAPEINVSDITVTAENRVFDPIYESNVSVSDGIDENPTLEVIENNVNIKKEGEYRVKFRATNEFNKQSEKTMTVKVVANNPDLTAEDITFTTNQSQLDIVDLLNANANDLVDDDLTNSIKVLEDNIIWNKNGRYTVKLAVTNSNNKTTQLAVNVKIDIKYSLTVDYLDEYGNKVADSKVIELNQGTEITEDALEINGYNVDKSTITTNLDKNKNIKFVYSKVIEPEIPVEPEIPTEPEEPVKPVEPVEPVEPEKPTEPVKPTDPEKPTEPENVTDKEVEEPLYQTNSNSNIALKALIVSLMFIASFGLIKFNLKKDKE